MANVAATQKLSGEVGSSPESVARSSRLQGRVISLAPFWRWDGDRAVVAVSEASSTPHRTSFLSMAQPPPAHGACRRRSPTGGSPAGGNLLGGDRTRLALRGCIDAERCAEGRTERTMALERPPAVLTLPGRSLVLDLAIAVGWTPFDGAR
jgi:hypothetical protein